MMKNCVAARQHSSAWSCLERILSHPLLPLPGDQAYLLKVLKDLIELIFLILSCKYFLSVLKDISMLMVCCSLGRMCTWRTGEDSQLSTFAVRSLSLFTHVKNKFTNVQKKVFFFNVQRKSDEARQISSIFNFWAAGAGLIIICLLAGWPCLSTRYDKINPLHLFWQISKWQRPSFSTTNLHLIQTVSPKVWQRCLCVFVCVTNISWQTPSPVSMTHLSLHA